MAYLPTHKDINDKSMHWQVLKEEVAFGSRWLTVRQQTVKLPNGAEIDDYFLVDYPHVVLVVAVTEDNQLVLEKEYRHGIAETTLEFPAGTYNIAKEKPEDAARRELKEETGYEADELIYLGTTTEYPTKATNTIRIYLAPNVRHVGTDFKEVTENIKLVNVPLDSLQELIDKRLITVSGSVVAATWALRYLETHKD